MIENWTLRNVKLQCKEMWSFNKSLPFGNQNEDLSRQLVSTLCISLCSIFTIMLRQCVAGLVRFRPKTNFVRDRKWSQPGLPGVVTNTAGNSPIVLFKLPGFQLEIVRLFHQKYLVLLPLTQQENAVTSD